MKLIVAVDERWGIGKNRDLLISIPDDMMYYRQTTRGKVVVMGYTTLLSLPNSKPQPGRLNLVLADIEGLKVPGAVVCGSMEQLIRLIGCFDEDDVFDIGGGSMYRQLLPYCKGAHITKMAFDGEADTFIPNLDDLPEWSVKSTTEEKEFDGIRYAFVEYQNASPAEIEMRDRLSSDMSRYFKKKEPLRFSLIDSDDSVYRDELLKIMRAYYHPLSDGFGAEDVERFFRKAGESSFEDYLREQRLIAWTEDLDNLYEKYRFTGRSASVTVMKESLSEFEEDLGTLTFDQITAKYL